MKLSAGSTLFVPVFTLIRLILATSEPLFPSISLEQIKRSLIADEYLAEEIHLNCNDERSLVAGSTSANKLAR